MSPRSRRSVLRVLSAGIAGGVAGCAEQTDGGSGETPTPTPTTTESEHPGLRKRWERQYPQGEGPRFPVVWNDTLYTEFYERDHLYALDASSGEVASTVDFGSPLFRKTATPEELYAGLDAYSVAALTPEHEIRWTAQPERTGRELRGPTYAPAVTDDTVLAYTKSNHVYAVDRDAGAVRWRDHPYDGADADGRLVQAPPIVSDGVGYVLSNTDSAYGYDLESGDRVRDETTVRIDGHGLLWQWGFQAYDGAAYFVCKSAEDPAATRIAKLRLPEFATEFVVAPMGETQVDRVSRPLLHDGTLYVAFDGVGILALDAEDGAERWRYETNQTEGSYHTPQLVDGTLYAVTPTELVGLDPSDGSPRWSHVDDEKAFGWIAATEDGLYVVNRESLIAYTVPG